MRIVCGKSALVESINIVSKAVGSKATQPILECCLLTADSTNGFKLTANDMELAIESKGIESDILEDGSIALDSKVFFDIVRRLPGSDVEIYTDDKNLAIIKSGKSEFKILGMGSEEFPAMPLALADMDDGHTISAAEFKNMIRQTVFSVSQDTSRPVLCGELMEISGGTIKMVSVDGFRISLRKYDFESGENDIKVIIPGKTLNEISKILPTDADAVVSIHATDRHILFDLENCTIVSRLLEGEFINYENMFTKEAETIVNIDRATLFECIERAALISRDAKKSPVKLKIENGEVVITSNTEVGTSYEEMVAEQNGPGLEIAFNPRYISDVLRVLECDGITMEFTTPLSPCIIKVEGSDDYRYLVLPLRLRS